MIRLRRSIIVLMVVVLAAFMLVACGGTDVNMAEMGTAVAGTTDAFTNSAEGTAEALAADAQSTADAVVDNAETSVESSLSDAQGTASAVVANAQSTAAALDETVQQTVTAQEVSQPEVLIDEAPEDFDTIMSSTRLIGMEITDDNGETVGEVEEVLFDRTGQIRYLIFDAGNVLSLAQKLVAVEWELIDPLTIDPVDEGTARVGFVFTASTNYLETRPEIDRVALDVERPIAQIPNLETEFDILLRASWFNADTPNAVNLLNLADDDLGEVEELVFDMDDGEVLYGIAEVGGFLEVAEAPVVIDWSEMAYDESIDSLIVDADEETLTNAPMLNLDELGENVRLDPDWDIDFRRFWQGT